MNYKHYKQKTLDYPKLPKLFYLHEPFTLG